MTWPKRELIADSISNLLLINLALVSGERLLVMSDVPEPEDWRRLSTGALKEMLERAALGREVVEVAQQRFRDCAITFLPFPATGAHGREPDSVTASRMLEADVIVALTTYSLSHTDARESATKAGARVASMPTFTAEMLAPDGPMAVDAHQIADDSRKLAGLLTVAREAVVRTPYGTNLQFSIADRQGIRDDGIYVQPGCWGNLPAGEAYVAPVEGTADGQLVVPAGWHADLVEDMTFEFEKGSVIGLRGGGAVGDRFRRLLDFASSSAETAYRRNLAELGIGCNPRAVRADNILEAEKIKGTVHLAIGDNSHMGGRVTADLHQDFVQHHPDLLLDGRLVIANGVWQTS